MASFHESLKQAQKIEKARITFYSEMLQKSLGRETEKVAQYLLEEEKGHLKFLLEIEALVNEGETADIPTNQLVRDRPFPEDFNADFYASQPSLLHNEIEVLEHALDLEKEDIRIYQGLAERCSDQKGRELFQTIRDLEQIHVNALKNKIEQFRGAE